MRKPADQASFYRVLVKVLLYLFSGSSKVEHINMDVSNPRFRRIHELQVKTLLSPNLLAIPPLSRPPARLLPPPPSLLLCCGICEVSASSIFLLRSFLFNLFYVYLHKTNV